MKKSANDGEHDHVSEHERADEHDRVGEHEQVKDGRPSGMMPASDPQKKEVL